MFLLHHKRDFVDRLRIQVLENMGARHIAKQRNLVLELLRYFKLGAADDNIRADSHLLQFLNALLGGFCFELTGAVQIRNQRYVDHAGIAGSDLDLELPDRFKERLGLNVSDRTADFDDCYSIPFLRIFRAVKSGLDFIRDMRDDLHRASAVITMSFLINDRPVNLARGHIGIMI